MSTPRAAGGRTQRAMCAGMLGLQAIVFLLTTPVLLTLTSVRTGVGLGIGLGLTVACLLVAGLVRRPGGLQLGFVRCDHLPCGGAMPEEYHVWR